jgi:hypothetical protein
MRGSLRREQLVFIVVIVALVAIIQSPVFAFEARRSLAAQGIIVYGGVGVYQDASGTTPLTVIDWGYLYPGDTVTTTLYVRNEVVGNVSIGVAFDDWTPIAASTFLSITWELDGDVLGHHEVARLDVTLNVSALIRDIDSFTFTVSITALTDDV